MDLGISLRMKNVRVVNVVLLVQSSFTIGMCVEYHCRSITAFVMRVDHLVVRLCSCWARSEGQKENVETSQRVIVTIQVLELCLQIVMGFCCTSVNFLVLHNKLGSLKMWIPNKDIIALITFFIAVYWRSACKAECRERVLRCVWRWNLFRWLQWRYRFALVLFGGFHSCLTQRNFWNNFTFWQ